MQTIPGFFLRAVEKFSGNVFLWENRGGGYRGTTFEQVREQVYRLAAGLISLGVQKGDRIALLSEARSDWVVAELAILFAGAVNVPLSARINEPEELIFRMDHSGARFIIVSGNHIEKIRTISGKLETLERVIVLDNITLTPGDEMTLNEVFRLGEEFLVNRAEELQQRVQAVAPDDYANISYTSGTTSSPRGIILTHRNFMVNVEQAYSLMDIASDYVTLLILPWDHAFAHTAGIYCFMGKGASIASVQVGKTMLETLKNLPANILEIKPHLMYSVPAIAKNFKKNIEKGIAVKGPPSYRFFQWALNISYAYNGNGLNRGKGWRALLAPPVHLADRLLFRKVREAFGGRLEYFIGGGALLDTEIQKFFYAIGIPMLQGYGLTEAAPLISANTFNRHKLGSSGLVVKNLELKICDEQGTLLPRGSKGEIVVKGGNVMAGYWKNEEATAETLQDGWLHTGDMGYLDDDGFLYVLGRFKSLLIADDGEKYSPEGMEETIMVQSRYIEQCMLYNNQKPYTIVLVFPNRERLLGLLREKHLDPGSAEGLQECLVQIGRELQHYRTGRKFGDMFPQRWLPAAIGILTGGFTEENHLLNFQLKIVRGKVVEKYHHRIESLYTPAGKNIINDLNLEALRTLLEAKV